MNYNFENYVLDVDRQELRHGDDLVAVDPKVFDLLHYLILNRERVVSKDDLIAHVWDGRIVSDSTLTSRITIARQAVGDSGAEQRLIRTIARKGIRFVGEIQEGGPSAVISTPMRRDTPPLTSAGGTVPQLPEKPSIAVLPFTNMSGDSEQEYFSDGITEDIITALSRLRWFFVIARNSTFVYKGRASDVRQVGRDLGVRYILEGSVRKNGQQVRISAQLVDATTGNHIWAARYDRELTDIFVVQDEITERVTTTIEPKLLAAEGERAGTRSIDTLDAWDLVARALSHFWKLTAAESETAIAILREAVGRHPNYGPAHSMLSFALIISAYVGWIPADREAATQLAQRAAELDNDDPWAHVAMGYLAFTARKTDEALHHFRAALDLNPNFAAAYGAVGWALVFDGQSEEASRCFEKAVRMNPHDPLIAFIFAGFSAAHYFAGRYDEAVKWGRQAVQLRPGLLGGHRMLCASLALAGQIKEAQSALKTLRQLQPNVSIAWIKQSVPYTPVPMTHFLEGLHKAGLTE